MTNITESRLVELEALANAATPGTIYVEPGAPGWWDVRTEWTQGDESYDVFLFTTEIQEVAAFIAASRQAIPDLIAAFRDAWAERDDAKAEAHDRHIVQARCTDDNRVLRRQIEKTTGRLDDYIGRYETAHSDRLHIESAYDAMKAERDALAAQVARVRALAGECATANEPDGSVSVSPVRWFAGALRAALDGDA